jgi:hypothetical protein
VQQLQPLQRWNGRAIGLDLHRDFCEVAICEDGVVRSAGRVKLAPEGLEALAASLVPTDRVALEVSGGAWEVARILEPHVERVVVVSPAWPGLAAVGATGSNRDLSRVRREAFAARMGALAANRANPVSVQFSGWVRSGAGPGRRARAR